MEDSNALMGMIQPSQTLRLDTAVQVFFSSDGRLYLEHVEFPLNLWNVVVLHWREVLGAIAIMLLLLTLLAVLRVVRTPRRLGEFYCRKCNYSLYGIPDVATCPECGSDLRKQPPVVGARLSRRIACPLAVTAVFGAIYGSLLLMGAEREHSAINLFRWDSPWLAQLAHDRKIGWLEKCELRESVLDEVSLLTGERTRLFSIHNCPSLQLSVAPDGRSVIAALFDGRLARLDIRTGSVMQVADARPGPWMIPGFASGGWNHVAGWPSPDSVCVQWIEHRNETSALYSWDMKLNHIRQVATIPTFKVPGNHGYVQSHRLYLVPSTASLTALEVPDHIDNLPDSGALVTLRLRDLNCGSADCDREFANRFRAGSMPIFCSDGSAFFIRGRGMPDDLMLISTSDGSEIGSLNSPGFLGALTSQRSGEGVLSYHDMTKRLFVSTDMPASVHVRDTAKKEWIAELDCSSGMDAHPDGLLRTSPDGRWVVTTVWRAVVSTRSRFVTEHFLLIFDLSTLNTPAEPTTTGSESPR